MTAVRHPGFPTNAILGPQLPSCGQYEAAHQILCKSVKSWLRYTTAKMAAVRHLGFVILQFWTTHKVPLMVAFSLKMA